MEQKVWICGEPIRVRKGKSRRLQNIWGIPVAQGDTDVNAIGSPFPSGLSWREGGLCENSTDWPMRKHPPEAIIVPSGTENYNHKSLEVGRCLIRPEGKNFSTLPVTSWCTESCLFFCITWNRASHSLSNILSPGTGWLSKPAGVIWLLDVVRNTEGGFQNYDCEAEAKTPWVQQLLHLISDYFSTGKGCCPMVTLEDHH